MKWERWEGRFRRQRTYVYCGWFMLMCGRNQHNIGKQYPPIKNQKNEAEDNYKIISHLYISSVQLLSRVWLFATPWTAARQASLSITNSQSLLKPMSIESLMPSTISSSVVPFSSCLQSFPASGSFQTSQFFTSGDKSFGVSASTSVLPRIFRTDFL